MLHELVLYTIMVTCFSETKYLAYATQRRGLFYLTVLEVCCVVASSKNKWHGSRAWREKLFNPWNTGNREKAREPQREKVGTIICPSKSLLSDLFLPSGPTPQEHVKLWPHQYINPLMRVVPSWSKRPPLNTWDFAVTY